VVTTPGLENLAAGVRLERLKIFDSAEYYRPTVATAAAIRATMGLVLLTVKRYAAVATVACTNDEPSFIDELQWD
jgi:hypothetical protein